MFRMPKIKLDGISINTVLVFGAVIGVIYIGYKLKQGAESIGNAWDELDLNPFDAGSAIPSAIDSIGNTLTLDSSLAVRQAFAAKGLDYRKYKMWVGGRGSVVPSNAVFIQTGRTGTFYVPVKSPII